MGRFKCNWDRIATPPEEMMRIRKGMLKVTLIFSMVLISIGSILLALFWIRGDLRSIALVSYILIGAGIFSFLIMLIPAYFIGSYKYHNAVKMNLKFVTLSRAEEEMERFLKEKGINYQKEKPKGSKYRGYLSHTDVGFFIKKELFIGIEYFYHEPLKKQLRKVTIFYLPSIWEEALLLQKEMDEHFFRSGIAEPFDKSLRLVVS